MLAGARQGSNRTDGAFQTIDNTGHILTDGSTLPLGKSRNEPGHAGGRADPARDADDSHDPAGAPA